MKLYVHNSEMKQKFLSSLFLIVLLNVLIKPFYILGIDAEVQNRVGEVAYGNYYALLNFSFLLNILLDLGITNYNARNIAQHPHLIQKNFGRIMGVRFSLFFLYFGFSSILAVSFGYNSNEFWMLGVLFFNQFLVAVIQFSRSNFAGLHLFKSDAFISVLDRSLLIVFVGVLLWGNVTHQAFQIEWFIYAQTAAYFIAAITSISLLKKHVYSIKLSLERLFSIALIKKSFPFALLIFLMMMYNRMDAVMLERLLPNGDEQAGIYAQGYRYLDAVNMFALLFAGILLPIFARMLKQRLDTTDLVRVAVGLLLTVSVCIASIGFFYQNELIGLRYTDASNLSKMTFGMLILSFVPVSLTYIYGTLLTANGSLKALNYMALGGLIANFILNLILIQSHQALGAAMATLITQTLTAVVQIVLAYRMITLQFSIKRAFLLCLSAGIIILGTWLIKTELDLNQLFLEVLLIFVIAVVSVFALRLIQIKDLIALFKAKS